MSMRLGGYRENVLIIPRGSIGRFFTTCFSSPPFKIYAILHSLYYYDLYYNNSDYRIAVAL